MGNMEFRYKRFGQYLGMVLLIPLIVFLLSLFFPIIGFRGWADRISVGDYPNILGVTVFLFFLIMAGLILLEIWLFIGMAFLGLSYKIAITSTALLITGWDFWGRKLLNQMNHGYYLGKIPYESIVSISFDSWKPGVLKLSFRDGSYIFLPGRGLENHTEFIIQLSEKLVNTKGVEALAKINQPKRFKVLQTLIYSIAFAPTVFLLFFMLVDKYEPKVWKEEFTPWTTLGITSDSDGTVWISADNRKDNIYIWRISETKRYHWTLPYEICKKCDAYSISHDDNGYPQVVNSEGDLSAIYSWDGDSWERTTMDIDFFSEYPNALNTKIWGKRENSLISVDFSTNAISENYLPSEMLSDGFEIREIKVNLDGSLLATFVAKDKPQYLYRFADEKWHLIGVFSAPDQRLWEFCQDFKGTIWALITDVDKHQTRIGSYDEKTGKWSWKELRLTHPDRKIAYFSDMAVDSQDRIWIYGVYDENEKENYLRFVSVVDPKNDPVVPVIEYTDENSNLDFSQYFVVTNDRIWLGRFGLTWIDTTEELPSPYPEWVVRAKDFYDNNFGWYLLVFLGQILLAIIGASLEYK
jgi:streptogramin lyase